MIDQPDGKYYAWKIIDNRQFCAPHKKKIYCQDILTKTLEPPTELPPDTCVEYIGKRTWGNGWFCHHTLDEGQSDKEILDSFREFVWWVESLPEESHGTYKDYGCLMGAEDRWRWSGESEDRNPPCRCEHCKKQGVIRISH